MSNELRVVKVVWIDPHSVDDWTDVDDLEKEKICKVIAVGFLLKETADKIVLTLNYSASGNDSCCTMIIPKACVLSINEVCLVEKEP